jgi:hypothetical protein
MRKVNTTPISFTGPASYQIEVQGALDPSWGCEFGNLHIEHRQRENSVTITQLTGEVPDQAALAGLLDLTYMLGMPLLSVVLFDVDLDLHGSGAAQTR